jgi:tripartite-type tricarboxylate transporter receptor subunit TctC
MRMSRPGVNALIRGLIFALVATATPLAAEPWPQRPVRLIVPIAAGTGSDIAARQFAERLAERWKQPVVVENRPGADGLVGTVAFAAMRDDHVLLFSPAAPISVFPQVHEKLPYDPARDIVPIASATNTFVMLAASAALKVHSLKELVALARSRPGTLNWSSGGGALTYVLGGFLTSTKLDMVSIPYREQGRALQDLASGRVHVMITVLAALLPQVSSGKVTLLAATNNKRAPIAPEVSTVTELGYPELAFEGLWGFFGPGNIPAARRDQIAADIRAIAADSTLAERLSAIGQSAHAGTPEEFVAEIEDQRHEIASIVKMTGAGLRQ